MLKGTATIELTDVKTGKKEIVKHNNLVTNAVGDILTMNPDGYRFATSFNFEANMLPVCPNLFGGILLYENALDEDPAKYYAPDNNPLTGYSSNDVNEGNDIKRGSMNQTESGPLEDNSGYRFVFDFSTSQANGTISALGLTSKWGGVAGYGSELDGQSPILPLTAYSIRWEADAYADNRTRHQHIVSIEFDGGEAYFAYVSAPNTIEVGKLRLVLNEIRLNSQLGPRDKNIMEYKTVSTATFGATALNKTSYFTLLDDGAGNIWGFEHANNAAGNSSGNATVNWIKISKADLAVSEGTWTIPAQLYRFGENLRVTAGNQLAYKYAIIHNGFLYCMNYAKSKIIKINLDNPSDILEIDDPDGAIPVAVYAGNVYGISQFNVVGNVIYYPGGYIVNDKAYPVATAHMTSNSETYGPTHNSVSPYGVKGSTSPKLQIGPFLLGYTYYHYSYNTANYRQVIRYLYLMTPYLATINNLDTPVEKTADKTMKITYILREEM